MTLVCGSKLGSWYAFAFGFSFSVATIGIESTERDLKKYEKKHVLCFYPLEDSLLIFQARNVDFSSDVGESVGDGVLGGSEMVLLRFVL